MKTFMTELQIAQMEAERNDSGDRYWAARALMTTDIERKIFDDGFERGYKAALAANQEKGSD